MRYIALLLILLPGFASAQRVGLSDKAQISVITCGPSKEELYAAFGHSAIRVHDPELGYDAAYNYGVFDFNQPNFYLNFAKGFLYYRLGVYDYQSFQSHYILENRYVHEQVLDLTADQKQKVFDYLQLNALPENQSYRYDYFYNNCATKIRDVIEAALGNKVVKFDGTYVKTDYTIRELTDIHLKEHPWGDLGIDICLGLPMDKVATPYEYMFLPDYIESGFDNASIVTGSGRRPIVGKKNSIYEAREQDPEGSIPHPLYFTIALCLIGTVLSYVDLKKKNLSFWFDCLIFGVTGMIGFLLCFLWFFTDHNAAARNLNIIWALPFHLIAIILFYKNPDWLKDYFLFIAVLSAALIVGWPLLPQKLHFALIPIVLAQGIRAYTQYKIRSTKKVLIAKTEKAQPLR